MDKIAIFCSASDNIDPVYFDKAREYFFFFICFRVARYGYPVVASHS